MSLRNMELRAVRHVVTLARLLSYTKAARELNVTQSGLTRSIQQFEDRAGVRLFDRDRGGVRLTQVGREFVARAEPVLQDAEDLALVLQKAAAGEQGKISIGMAPIPAKSLLPELISGAINSRPNVRFDVSVREADSLLQLLLTEEIDFFVCLAGQLAPPARVIETKIAKFPMSLLVRAEHPLVSGGDIKQRRFPLIMSAHVAFPHDSRMLLEPYVDVDPVLIASDLHLLSRVTQDTDSVWLSSYLAAAEEIRDGTLVEWPAFRGVETSILLYRLERRTLSPIGNDIIRSVNALARRIISEATSQ
jgi:DNA-binding transcriptional LysR family regulator